jgi:tyrosine-protein kinase Etk/Wzc
MRKNNSVATANPEQEEDLDFFAILDIFIENRGLILAITAIFFVGAAMYALLATPVYESDIMVQVEETPDSSAAKSLIGDISSLFDVKSTASAESQILGSRLVVGRTVDQLHLFIEAKPRRFPIVGDWIARHDWATFSPGFLGFGGFGWGNESIDVPIFDVPPQLEGKRFQLTALGAGQYELAGKALDHPLKVTAGKEQVITTAFGNITLRIRGIVGGVGAVYNMTRRSRDETVTRIQHSLDIQEKVKESGVLIAVLQASTPDDVSQQLNEIGRQYIRQNIERKSAEAAQSLVFLSEQLPQIKSKVETAQSRYTNMRNAQGVIDLTEEAKLDLSQAVDAQTRLLELKQKREELRLRFGPSHPAIRSLSEQIATLDEYHGTIENKITRLPNSQQDAVRLLLDVQVNTDLYTSLLGNYYQLQLVKAGKVGSVRLVDVASTPDRPIKPKRLLILVAGLGVGLAIGVAIALLRSILFRGVTDPNEIERRAELSVYATIPFSQIQNNINKGIQNNGNETALLALAAPNEPAIESLRSLRTTLQFAMLNTKNNIVLITGTAPKVGKSFVSANFAAILAKSGKRVLLIDLDLRKGTLHRYFSIERSGGVTDLIAGTMSVNDVVHRGVMENLDFISTGSFPPNPADLLIGPGLEDLVNQFSTQYDIVLVDTAPVLAVSDTGIIAPIAGTIFLVTYSGITKMGEITESIKRMRHVGVEISGVVFNGMSVTADRYKYGSKYGSYRYVDYNYSSGGSS